MSHSARPRAGDSTGTIISWILASAGMRGPGNYEPGTSSRLHVGEELPYFRFQPFCLDRNGVGEVLDVGGGCPGVGRGAGNLAHGFGADPRLAGGPADALGDRGYSRV